MQRNFPWAHATPRKHFSDDFFHTQFQRKSLVLLSCGRVMKEFVLQPECFYMKIECSKSYVKQLWLVNVRGEYSLYYYCYFDSFRFFSFFHLDCSNSLRPLEEYHKLIWEEPMSRCIWMFNSFWSFWGRTVGKLLIRIKRNCIWIEWLVSNVRDGLVNVTFTANWLVVNCRWRFEISSTTIKKAYIYSILVTFSVKWFIKKLLYLNVIFCSSFMILHKKKIYKVIVKRHKHHVNLFARIIIYFVFFCIMCATALYTND